MQDLQGQVPPGSLLTAGGSFDRTDNIVSTSVFSWYTPTGGQVSGPWEPLGGRTSWTGGIPFWKDQVKQMMTANIDELKVHLFDDGLMNGFPDTQRTNLFEALSELRHEGYDVPKVTPFLDPIITWGTTNSLNVATTAGKQEFIRVYENFYNQYFSVNTDAFADSYLTRIDGCVALDVWHTHLSLLNQGSLSRADVESRLQSEFGAAHPLFNDGIYMVTTDCGCTLNFADEQQLFFQTPDTYKTNIFNNLQSAQVKPGYWDQNVRNPGTFVARNGGAAYANVWNQVIANKDAGIGIDRVYIESWNEYDEGTGIYAAEAQPPNVLPLNTSGNTDTWSNSAAPYEYIKTTAVGARLFNDTPDLDATFLWGNFPGTMLPGETVTVQMIVRNDGDVSWTDADNFKLGQNEITDQLFGAGRFTINDATNEIPIYGGIFRGRPIVFDVELTAPLVAGEYLTHWQMLQEFNVRFGEELSHTITVRIPADFDFDNDVDGNDFLAWQRGFGTAYTSQHLTEWETNFGNIAALSSSASAVGAVPEPTTLTLMLLTFAGGPRRRLARS